MRDPNSVTTGELVRCTLDDLPEPAPSIRLNDPRIDWDYLNEQILSVPDLFDRQAAARKARNFIQHLADLGHPTDGIRQETRHDEG